MTVSGTGELFGPYRLVELIGRGGMGEVYRAFDTSRERFVALKLLPPELASDESFSRRFQREAQLAARLNNPHIVPIHDFGEIEGRLYIDMRLVDGIDLGRAVADGPLDPERAADIISQVANALDAAHQAGLVHRDVKPGNVLLSGDEPVFAYLTDFGIAVTRSESTNLTATGTVVGSWAYLAPERFSDGTLDHRSDIYALGCVLYELLVGKQPFAADSIETMVAGHLMTPPPKPSEVAPSIPKMFDEVIARGLAKQPSERYRTAGELGAAARTAAASGVGGRSSSLAAGAAPRAVAPSPGASPTRIGPVGPAPGVAADATVFGQPPPDAFPTDPYFSPVIDWHRTNRGKQQFEELQLHPPRLGPIEVRGDYQMHTGPLPHNASIPFLGNQKHVDSVRQRLRHSTGGAILLTGFNGVGKTTVVRRALAELRAELTATSGDSLPVVELWERVARPISPDELMMRLIRNLRETLDREGLTDRIPPHTSEALATAYNRTLMTLKSTQSNANEGSLTIKGEAFGMGGSTIGGKRTRTLGQEQVFLTYTLGDAEHDFLRIVNDLSSTKQPPAPTRRRLFARVSKPWQCRIVVIFDELDKLTADNDGLTCLEEILRQLKNVLTSSEAHFVFLAGPETFEAARAARARGRGDWANVFGPNPTYIGCLQAGASQDLLQEVLVGGATGKSSQLLADYLEYRSRGLPRLLLSELTQLVEWNPTPHIVIDQQAAALISFYAALQRRLGPRWAEARPLGPLTERIDIDRRRMATYQVMDWVLARAGASFTTADFLADRANAHTGTDILPDEEVDGLFRELAACGMLDCNDPMSPDHTILGPRQPTGVVYQLAQVITDAAHKIAGAPDDLGRVGDGRYILKEELGRGALGRMYRALDRHTNYDVAIKLLDLPELRHDELARERFLREVDLARWLDHPLLAAMSDSIDDDGQLGLVTEFVRGRSLAAHLRDGPLPWVKATRMGQALADLLTYLDGQGVFRLDLKPSNIVVRNDGTPVVVELGLARRAQDQRSRLTGTGLIVGTPLYLAPEQLMGGEIDIRADVYTLGLLIYEMLTGRPVRQGDALPTIVCAAMEPVDVSGLPCPEQLKSVLDNMLEVDPRCRYPKPTVVARHLKSVLEAGPRQ